MAFMWDSLDMDKGRETASYVPIDAPVSMRHRVGMMFFIVLVLSLKLMKPLSPVFLERKQSSHGKWTVSKRGEGFFSGL